MWRKNEFITELKYLKRRISKKEETVPEDKQTNYVAISDVFGVIIWQLTRMNVKMPLCEDNSNVDVGKNGRGWIM